MANSFTLRDSWPLAKQTFDEWSEDKAPKMAAALAYFTVLSIAPLLVVIIKIVAIRYGNDAAANELHNQLSHLTDPQVADAMRDLIPKSGNSSAGTFAAILSLVIAIGGASGVFAELQDSLNTIWEVRPKPNRGILGIIRDRIFSISMVFGIAFLLLVSMVVSSVLTGASQWLIGETIGTSGAAAKIIALVIDISFSTAVITVLFAAMFKVLPDAKIKWGDVWLGAGVTAAMFQVGKYALSLYITLAKPGVAYGIAGSLVVLLVWIYYSSWILFLGAEFTQVYANKYGSKIVPDTNAVPLKKEMQEQMGVVHASSSSVSQTSR